MSEISKLHVSTSFPDTENEKDSLKVGSVEALCCIVFLVLQTLRPCNICKRTKTSEKKTAIYFRSALYETLSYVNKCKGWPNLLTSVLINVDLSTISGFYYDHFYFFNTRHIRKAYIYFPHRWVNLKEIMFYGRCGVVIQSRTRLFIFPLIYEI